MVGTLETNGFYEFGPYRLDRRARVLLRDGVIVPLTPKVLDTLVVLVERAGQPLSKEELLRAVWPDTFVEESNLAQNISVLRKALGRSTIETLAKRGYRFAADVHIPVPEFTAVPAPEPPPTPAPRRTNRRIAAATVVAAVMVCAGGGFWYYRQRVASPAPIRSLAVLPLKNLSGDTQKDYIADGITELLTTQLSKALPVRVVSGTSAMRYRNLDKPIQVIARELRVDTILEGSVAVEGDRLRVTTQLIDVASDRHLWAETYDRKISDVPQLQEEIALTIAREIRISPAPPAKHPSPISPDALEAYWRARYYLDQRTGRDMTKAINWYRQAIEADPAYAAPYAGLADCYNQSGTVMIGGRSPAEGRRLAMAAARRALEIDPESAEAHAALAYSNLYDWNWDAALKGFERAIRLNPNYPPAHLWLAHYFAARGNFDRAVQEVQLAADLDPLSPIVQTQVAWILSHAHRYPEAIRQYRKVLADDPSYQWALWQLGSALIAVRNYDEGIPILEKYAKESNRSASSLGTLGQAYAQVGRRKDAEALLDELRVRSRDHYVPPHAFVHIYVGLRDREKVFEWLEKSYEERSNSLLWIGADRQFPFRSDPRFDDLLRRIGFK